MASRNLTKLMRVTHLYVGVFISPAILFFAFSGAIQSFGFHETNRDHPNYVPARWLVVMGQIHKKQTSEIAVHAPTPPAAAAVPSPKAAVAAPKVEIPSLKVKAPKHDPVPMRVFFVLVAFGLLVSTVSGVYMSYVYTRNKRLVSVALVAGVVVPVLLLLI